MNLLEDWDKEPSTKQHNIHKLPNTNNNGQSTQNV